MQQHACSHEPVTYSGHSAAYAGARWGAHLGVGLGSQSDEAVVVAHTDCEGRVSLNDGVNSRAVLCELRALLQEPNFERFPAVDFAVVGPVRSRQQLEQRRLACIDSGAILTEDLGMIIRV